MAPNQAEQLAYVIVPCEDLDRMKAFYRNLLVFPVEAETPTTLVFRAGSVLLALRKRTRDYDGRGTRADLPGVQIAFLVSLAEVNSHYRRLVQKGVHIFDPPTDRAWGHRTLHFSDPEGNILEYYADIPPASLTGPSAR